MLLIVFAFTVNRPFSNVMSIEVIITNYLNIYLLNCFSITMISEVAGAGVG